MAIKIYRLNQVQEGEVYLRPIVDLLDQTFTDAQMEVISAQAPSEEFFVYDQADGRIKKRYKNGVAVHLLTGLPFGS